MIYGLVLCSLFLFQDGDLDYEEKVTISFVRLDIAAFDDQGRPVSDLELSDFVVSEDRKKVKISTFQKLEYNERSLTTYDVKVLKPAVTPSEDPPSAPQFIIVLDMRSALEEEIHVIFKQLDTFLASLSPNSKAGFMLYSMERGLRTKKFETDPNLVRSNLNEYKTAYFEKLEKRKKRGGRRRSATAHLPDNRTLAQLEEKLIKCKERYGDDMYNFESCALEELAANIAIQQERVLRIMDELEQLAYEFQEVPGLKTMLFVSPGFSLKPGQAAANMTTSYRNVGRTAVREDVNAVSDVRVEANGGGLNLMPVLPDFEADFQKVVHACVRNRVVFHSFDLFNHKLNRSETLSKDKRLPKVVKHAYRDFGKELNQGLISLAEESGGRFFSGPSLLEPLTLLVNERPVIYVLGYESPKGEPGKYRRIKVKCKRKKVELKHRRGYFGG